VKSLGVAIITFNEEENIERVIKSVPFATEVVVVDSHSQDRTREIAENCGAKVIQKDWAGYSEQKQFCLDQIKSDWILVLDGDEWLSPDLQEEISTILKSEHSSFLAYELQRNILFLKKLLRFGKGVDYQLRFFKNGVGHYDGREIHENIVTAERVGRLKGHIIHKSSKGIKDELEKMDRDTELERPYYTGQDIGLYHILYKPFSYFFTMLVIKGMWRDGTPAIIFLLLTTYKYVVLYSKLYEMSLERKSVPS